MVPLPLHGGLVRAAAALPALAAATALLALAPAQAAPQVVTITVENLAPASGIAFAPLHFGFHSGVFDAFDLGSTATAPIISVAEGGSGAAWHPAFAAADPGAVRGTVGGLLLAGATASLTVVVDPAVNPFFTFASMVVPSNDFFIGNDAPTGHRIFASDGTLLTAVIDQRARQVWDAGSEVFDPAAAAFVGDNDLRAPQHSVVAFNFAELAAFDGLMTGAGYTFTSGLAAETEVYRIGFSAVPVPEPGSFAMLTAGLVATGWLVRRRRPGAAAPA
ncbi:MAG: spondin domain-containing protein [Rubrivivax sp.]|nr:spondin domain-containing protein [Rubrivivax sp.]